MSLWSDDQKRAAVLDSWRQPHVVQQRKDWWEAIASVLIPGNLSRVLDVGCGAGHDYPLFQDSEMTYTGCDNCPEMLALARERYPEIDVFEDDVISPKLIGREMTSPLVISNGVLDHLLHPEIPVAIKNLVAATEDLLLIRWFGIAKSDFTQFFNGFRYNRFCPDTVLKFFDGHPPTNLLELPRPRTARGGWSKFRNAMTVTYCGSSGGVNK